MGRTSKGLAVLLPLLAVAFFARSGAGAAEPAAPSCAEGPARVGATIQGTPCDDRIVVPASVAAVEGGGGDDTILAAPITAATSCPSECRLGIGSQTFDGGPGDDIVFGERGNDILLGGAGNDRLFGGIGDDQLLGGPGDDRLAGGFGADAIDGEEGSDAIRGDGTIDRIFDTGAAGADTLSYATGVTPGFGGQVDNPGFPEPGGERGLRIYLGSGGQNANNGIAALGGGVDEVEVGAFEAVIGTPFADYIVGTAADESLYGGGGADVILGGGGADTIEGGADGDAETGDGAVVPRDPAEVSVGFMAAGQPGPAQLYLTGSSVGDTVDAAYSPGLVVFTLSGSSFDVDGAADCTLTPAPNPSTATCPLPEAGLDSLLLAGLGGDDNLSAIGFPSTASVVILGGEGGDDLSGGEASEEVLVDGPGPGADTLAAFGRDDALLHNGGADQRSGGDGNDLFLSVSICDDDSLDGGPGRDNASWARLEGVGVSARLDLGLAGGIGVGATPECDDAAELDSLAGIEDLEGSNQPDVFTGDAARNQLLGHQGADTYAALGGDDSILANSAPANGSDSDLSIDCGEGVDSALIDFRPRSSDPEPVGCESVREAEGNNFRTVTQLPPPPREPEPEPLPEPPKPALDRRPPATRITHRPSRSIVVRALPRRVSFRFLASEASSSFRCMLDRRPFRVCTAPRAYKLGSGRHVFRVFAIDAAGNRDRTPALFRFQIRRR